MPKRLTLLRHAKSDWSDSTLRDFDRPLNRRGEDNAPAMGHLLKEKERVPDLIISSDAARARATAELAAAAMGYPLTNIVHSHALYLAGPATLLDVLQDTAGAASHVMLVAHNPGMTELANSLSDARIDNLPTCGVFCVSADTDNWNSIANGQAHFDEFLCPKQDLD